MGEPRELNEAMVGDLESVNRIAYRNGSHRAWAILSLALTLRAAWSRAESAERERNAYRELDEHDIARRFTAEAQRDSARRWAKAWKRAAGLHRDQEHRQRAGVKTLTELWIERGEERDEARADVRRLTAEVERLREVEKAIKQLVSDGYGYADNRHFRAALEAAPKEGE